jgi:hypothetical protein
VENRGPKRSPLFCVASITNHKLLLTSHPFDALRLLRATLLLLTMIVVVSDAHTLSVHPTLSTIPALLFARLLAERIASKGRPDLSQMINLLPRNRICSTFISTPVNVRLALSPLRLPPFLSNKFLSNADRRLRTPKRRSPALSSRLPISRSGARHAKT